MPSTKEIRIRIKSVKSTRQITKAMEMVSAAKMRKAQMQTLATRSYARYAWELVQNLTAGSDARIHKLLRQPDKISKVLMVVMTSNRGLIAGFNSNIIQTALNFAGKYPGIEVVTLGKKGRDALRKAGLSIVADFEKKDVASEITAVSSLASLIIEDFLAGKYDKVVLIYMDYVSTLVQKPHVLELLPLAKQDLTLGNEIALQKASQTEYIFEPTAEHVLEHVLPKLTMMQIYQALLETNAAEHSARMVAMKNATDAAGDIVSELTLQYNQLRQSKITTELSEITAGRIALE